MIFTRGNGIRAWIFKYALIRHKDRPKQHPQWRGHYGHTIFKYTFLRNKFGRLFYD